MSSFRVVIGKISFLRMSLGVNRPYFSPWPHTILYFSDGYLLTANLCTMDSQVFFEQCTISCWNPTSTRT